MLVSRTNLMRKIASESDIQLSRGIGWDMGAASCPYIADEGWAGFRETKQWDRGESKSAKVVTN